MPLQNFNKTRQYTRYKRHVDESHERVSAGTVNKLQEDVLVQQIETNDVKDTAFEERVYTIFNNNLYANSMFIDCLKTGEYVNMTDSYNVEVIFATTSLGIKDVNADPVGRCISTTVYSPYGAEVEMNDFFLIANEDIPVGASIKYYLVTSAGTRWPINANVLKLPMHLEEPLKFGFSVMIEMHANALGEVPKLNGYAVLYWDAAVEDALGMTNPDLKRFPELEIGDDDGRTILIRDRAQDDKLVKVIEPLDTVFLTYDWDKLDGKLKFVKTVWPDYDGLKVEQIHRLTYGNYLNSQGETEVVLMIIDQNTDIDKSTLGTTKVRHACKNCIVHDTMSQEILDLLAQQNPGNLNQNQFL